jgi:3-isopropylmalate/(R)-2-methylmalate dehydratase small subunit
MEPVRTISSIAVPLPLPNIDTDQIIPKQFLKRIERTGYEDFLFYDWRYRLDVPGRAEPNPEFVLNRPEYRGARILIAEKNFGCGSSREHAAWALQQYGFRAILAPSFADIFFSNAGKNGLVLVRLPEEDVKLLLARSTARPQHRITVDLEAQTVTDDDGFHAEFSIDPFRRYCLLNGLDDIGLTLRHAADIDRFEAQHDRAFWLLPKPA